MITPAGRLTVSAISLAAAFSALPLGACARGPAPTTWDGTAAAAGEQPEIRFENQAQTYVDVYLIGETRQWWLGRVAPGARTTLRIREEALTATTSGYVRLAVLPNASLTMQAARDPRAAFTIAQPGQSLLDQRWTFRSTQVTSPEIFGVPVKIGSR
jgi:hypothetical protein